MKHKNILFLLSIITIIANSPPVQAQFELIPPRQIFRNYIVDYNLKYTLPKGFIEVDTITEPYIYPFESKPAPMNRNHFNVYNLIYSDDNNTMIILDLIHLSRQTEANARKVFKETDVTKNYLYTARGILASNKGIRSSEIEFDEQEISYYGKKELKRLGAEVAGEYTVKLTDPYLDYNYLTFRFIVIPYYLDIYTYIFYKEYSDKIGQDVSRKTRYALRFRHPQANR